jgi:hypothetical protein
MYPGGCSKNRDACPAEIGVFLFILFMGFYMHIKRSSTMDVTDKNKD